MSADLSGLFRPAEGAVVPAAGEQAGGWRVTRDGERATLDGAGGPVDALRLLCGVTWDGVAVSAIEGASQDARELLRAWGV